MFLTWFQLSLKYSLLFLSALFLFKGSISLPNWLRFADMSYFAWPNGKWRKIAYEWRKAHSSCSCFTKEWKMPRWMPKIMTGMKIMCKITANSLAFCICKSLKKNRNSKRLYDYVNNHKTKTSNYLATQVKGIFIAGGIKTLCSAIQRMKCVFICTVIMSVLTSRL